MQSSPSPNFAYLAHHDARLVALATQAEEHFANDPPTSIAKLRLFAEVLAKRAAAKVGLLSLPSETQQALVDQLYDRNVIGATQRSLFHDLRRAGNAAVHENVGDANEALHQLRMARELAVWFQRTFGNNRKFDPGPFVPPAPPKKTEAANPALHEELARLREQLATQAKQAEDAKAEVDAIRVAAEKEAKERLSAEERAAKAREDAAIWEALASEQVVANDHAAKATARSKELEAQNTQLARELAALQAAAEKAPAPVIRATIVRAAKASEEIVLDEAATRRIIDKQLRAAGWDVDSEKLTFERGVRPMKGKNIDRRVAHAARGQGRLGRLRALRRAPGRRSRRGEAKAQGCARRHPAGKAVFGRLPREGTRTTLEGRGQEDARRLLVSRANGVPKQWRTSSRCSHRLPLKCAARAPRLGQPHGQHEVTRASRIVFCDPTTPSSTSTISTAWRDRSLRRGSIAACATSGSSCSSSKRIS